jgi:glycosyltransferase involved in cell wall biosynthesis
MTLCIVIPVYSAGGLGRWFLQRSLSKLLEQQELPDQVIISSEKSFADEARTTLQAFRGKIDFDFIVNQDHPGIGNNSNSGLSAVATSHVWVMHQDDWLCDERAVRIVRSSIQHRDSWFTVTRVQVPLFADSESRIEIPYWSGYCRLLFGINTIGPPSTSIWAASADVRFAPDQTLTVDLDLYSQLYRRYGRPVLLPTSVAVGTWMGQTQHSVGTKQKIADLSRLFRAELGRTRGQLSTRKNRVGNTRERRPKPRI